MSKRMYKIEITKYPDEALIWEHEDDVAEYLLGCEVDEREGPHGTEYAFYNFLWEPEGWREHVASMIAHGHAWTPDREFFWPSETKMYLSRSTAKEKVNIVRYWGGDARILEAELSEFIPIEEANRRRKRERNAKKIARLEAEIERLKAGDAA